MTTIASTKLVAVVLLVAPVALSVARQCEIDIGPLLVGIAIAFNLQGCATLVFGSR